MSMAQYEAENLGENVIIERNEDKRPVSYTHLPMPLSLAI